MKLRTVHDRTTVARMDTAATTTPSANLIPDGFWIASDPADRTLEWGERNLIIGDGIGQDELTELVEDTRREAGIVDDTPCYDDEVDPGTFLGFPL